MTQPLTQAPTELVDDSTTVALAARREPAALARLYDRYVHRVFKYCFSRVGNAVEAEDLTSQTFMQAIEALPRYRHRGHFQAWLFAIARSKVIDHFRKGHRSVPLDEAAGSGTDPDYLAQIGQSIQLERLSGLISGLPAESVELLRLRYVADLPYSEIAALLGRNEEAVKKATYRLLDKIRIQLEADDD